MPIEERYAMLLNDLQKQGITVEPKASKWYWKAMAICFKIITFGKSDFMKGLSTTTGSLIGTPTDWEDVDISTRYQILRHEAKHIEQNKRYGFGNVWFGAFVVAIAYAFLPFPIGLAFCRASIEREAYAESIRVIVQLHGVEAARDSKSFFVSQYSSPTYLWMWPFKSQVERWFEEDLQRIIEEESA